MHIQTFCLSPFQQNTTIIYTENGDAIIVDPSCYDRQEEQVISEFIDSKKLNVLAVLNTHCHIDHVFGNAFCIDKYKVDLFCHEKELFTLGFAQKSAEMYGLHNYKQSPDPNRFVTDLEILKFGEIELQVIFGPGHTVGHVAFYSQKEQTLIGGDILFKGSFGRVDLPGGDIDVLKKTIHERIFTLPDETIVYPGHGETTSILKEKKDNYIWQF